MRRFEIKRRINTLHTHTHEAIRSLFNMCMYGVCAYKICAAVVVVVVAQNYFILCDSAFQLNDSMNVTKKKKRHELNRACIEWVTRTYKNQLLFFFLSTHLDSPATQLLMLDSVLDCHWMCMQWHPIKCSLRVFC